MFEQEVATTPRRDPKMYKLCLAALLALPMTTCAQTATPREKAPVGSLTESMVYVFNDAQYGHNRSLFGWSVVPEVNLVSHFGFQGDFQTLYVRSVYPGQSKFVMSAGPRYTFAPRHKATPFVFAEGGEMRLSTQYSPIKDWNPVGIGGFGFEGRISRGIAFTMVPGEYIGQYLDNGAWNHSYSARAGITFNLYR
jgi:hypothetical protein